MVDGGDHAPPPTPFEVAHGPPRIGCGWPASHPHPMGVVTWPPHGPGVDPLFFFFFYSFPINTSCQVTPPLS